MPQTVIALVHDVVLEEGHAGVVGAGTAELDEARLDVAAGTAAGLVEVYHSASRASRAWLDWHKAASCRQSKENIAALTYLSKGLAKAGRCMSAC